MNDHQHAFLKYITDVVAVTTIGAYFLQLLPSISFFLSAVWLIVQLSDWSTKSDSKFATVVRFLTRRHKAVSP